MKKISKNKKKLLLSFGAITTIVAPIASSVSFASTPAQDHAAWQSFYAKVNDTSTDAANSSLFNEALKNKLSASNFYKTQTTGSNKWSITSADDMFNVLHALQKSNEFTDEEKVAIGKRIISNQMCADLFKNYGFTGETTQAQIVAASGTLTDPVRPSNNFLINNNTVKLVGTTGRNTDWKAGDISDEEYNFSNQTILDYYLAAVTKSKEFGTLMSDLTQIRHNLSSNAIGFKQALLQYAGDSRAFLEKISSVKLPIGVLQNIDAFKILTPADVSLALSDDEAYVQFMNSPLAQALYPNGENLNKIKAFTAETDSGFKKDYFTEVLTQFSSHLSGFKNVDSKDFNNISDATDGLFDTTKPEVVGSVTDFAKILAGYSNNFTSDVQVRVINDPINGYAVGIKTGHNLAAWNFLNQDDLKLPYFVLGDSNWDLSLNVKNVIGQAINNTGIKTTIAMSRSEKINLGNGGDQPLEADRQEAVHSGNARGFYAQLTFNFNGVKQIPNWVWLYENDHDDDGAVKHKDWTASVSDVSWSSNVNNHIDGAALNFYFDTDETHIDSTAAFPSLTTAVNNAIDEITKKVISIANGETSEIAFDPTAVYTFQISLDSINFGETYFNTYDDWGYDDTHADHFRFKGVSADFSYTVFKTIS